MRLHQHSTSQHKVRVANAVYPKNQSRNMHYLSVMYRRHWAFKRDDYALLRGFQWAAPPTLFNGQHQHRANSNPQQKANRKFHLLKIKFRDG